MHTNPQDKQLSQVKLEVSIGSTLVSIVLSAVS